MKSLIIFSLFAVVRCGVRNTQVCKIEEINPYTAEVLSMYRAIEDPVCSYAEPIVKTNLTHIWIDEEAKKTANVSQKLRCFYKPFTFSKAEGRKFTIRNAVVKINTRKYFDSPVEVRDEYVEVFCTTDVDTVYNNIMAFPSANRVVTIFRQYKHKWYDEGRNISVLLLGISSVSREQFSRQLPTTKQYLEALEAFELKGLAKASYTKFKNIFGMLTGMSDDEVLPRCADLKENTMDSCNFMWKEFKNYGYITALGEDTSNNGPFLDDDNGFSKKQTDFYLQPYMLMNEDFTKVQHAHCARRSTIHQALFGYVTKFLDVMTNVRDPFWGMFWGDSHSPDNFNLYPSLDDSIVRVLTKLVENNLLNRTVVIIASDQGWRKGPFIKHAQAHHEERHPAGFILVPEWFDRVFPKAMNNLRDNVNRLTTHYDIGATMKDILEISTIGRFYRYRNGISLFSPISEKRTCKHARILEYFCPCAV